MAALLAFARVGGAQTDSRTVRRGTDDVTVVGERDGWTEIVLRNGKRALVPSSEVETGQAPSPRPRTTAPRRPRPTAVPATTPNAAATTAVTPPAPDTLGELRVEVQRLRAAVDKLAAMQRTERAATPPPAEPAARSWAAGESLGMLALALVTGILVGGAIQRQRARRSRSLRF